MSCSLRVSRVPASKLTLDVAALGGVGEVAAPGTAGDGEDGDTAAAGAEGEPATAGVAGRAVRSRAAAIVASVRNPRV